MKEVWKDIPGTEGYKASNLGRIVGPRGKILKPNFSAATKTYRVVSLVKDGKKRGIHIQRLIAETFCGLKDGQIVKFKDGNRKNCKAENLLCLYPKENIDHGKTYTSEFGIWCSMRYRCNNPNEKSYKNYGGRGITVCKEWNNSFEAFLRDMGTRPSKRHQIDRIDNDKGYSPENCRWVLPAVNVRNRRNNKRLTLNGKTMVLFEWSRKLGIDPASLRYRLKNWPLEKALTTPKADNRK